MVFQEALLQFVDLDLEKYFYLTFSLATLITQNSVNFDMKALGA
jgi:hypothetical protein